MNPAHILVVDDEPLLREFLEETLRRHGHRVSLGSDADEGLRIASAESPDLALLDIRMRGRDGLSVLPELRQVCPDAPIIMMTGHGTLESAVQAMRLGAFDYLTKPFSADAIELAVDRALTVGALRRENAALKTRLGLQSALDALLGRSAAMEELKTTLRLIAPSRSTVLIQGESGTGKELVARAIHEGSPRASAPFVKINCAAVPAGLLESELFGHEKGAFTGAGSRVPGKFEQSEGGTLLLDEIGEMELSLQPKLLRALQEREFYRVGGRQPIKVDVRVLATTNADLKERVLAGVFREDLYHRLNVVPVRLGPLRHRREDIPVLAQHFLERAQSDNLREGLRIGRSAMETLLTYEWPGNVRELMNVIERAVILCPSDELKPEHFVLDLGEESPAATIGETLADREKAWILEVLEREGGNRTRAARKLGVSVRTIRNKLALYSLEGPIPAPPNGYAAQEMRRAS